MIQELNFYTASDVQSLKARFKKGKKLSRKERKYLRAERWWNRLNRQYDQNPAREYFLKAYLFTK